MMIDPLHEDDPGKGGFWKYRRIVDRRNFVEGTYKSDICLVNWPQNDYWLGNLIDVPDEEARKHLRRAKQLSLSLLYWMQTEAPARTAARDGQDYGCGEISWEPKMASPNTLTFANRDASRRNSPSWSNTSAPKHASN